MLRCLEKKNRKKRGFTLMEVMVVVGIIAVIAAIAIPSVISMQKNMDHQQRCDYAKTIFLAAQSNLVELRSTGELDKVEDDSGMSKAALQSGDIAGTAEGNLPEKFAERYLYTYKSDTNTVFDVVLPVNSVESVIRDNKIIIEYNPRTGSVYSVFYAEEYSNLVQDYQHGRLQRDAEWLKKNLVGYYDVGAMVNDSSVNEPEFYEVVGGLTYEDGQEGILTVEIPTQSMQNGVEDLVLNYESYIKALEIELTVIGENSGMFTKILKESGTSMFYTRDEGEGGTPVLQLTFTLDSLLEGSGFSSITENKKNTDDFHVLPGDNISLSAEITFAAGENDPVIIFDDAVLAGVNPLFHSLTGDSVNGYTIAVSNGRHLQNLNAMDPDIADKVSKITFVNGSDEENTEAPEIDWMETVEYYKEESNNMDCFSPINNRYLADAEVDGSNAIIRNLKINASGADELNDDYADAFAEVNTDVGLFRNINGAVHDLRIVNSIVRGGESKAVGVLAGSAGSGAVVSDCYVYVDTDAEDFSWNNLNISDQFDGSNRLEYGVSGVGAVGGLVGTSDGAQFEESLAAVPVYGSMNSYGDSLGVGGFVGVAKGGSFGKCYSSVRTIGIGAYSEGNYNNSCGLGGFVGTSHNAKYTNCFASGHVTHETGNLNACGGFVGVAYDDRTRSNGLFDSCYALGTVCTNGGTAKNQAKFVGTNITVGIKNDYVDRYKQLLAGKTDGYTYEGCYYLQGYGIIENDVDVCTLPAGYNLLHDLYGIAFDDAYIDDLSVSLGRTMLTDAEKDKLRPVVSDSAYRKGDWISGLNSKKNGHYPYMEGYKNNGANYPYSMLTGMPFYGIWPDAPSEVGIAYWELYDDNTMGIYYDQVSDTTLKNGTVIADGYMLLSANDPETPIVTFENGENKQTVEISFEGPVYIGTNSYHIGFIPSAVVESDSFYTKVGMNDKINSYTMYYNPNVAAAQINPVGTSKTAKNPGNYVPDEIMIRSARQLAAMGSKVMEEYWDEDFFLFGDIDFTVYGSVTNELVSYGISSDLLTSYGITPQTMGTIGSSAKSFTGTLTGVVDAEITVDGVEKSFVGNMQGGEISDIIFGFENASTGLIDVLGGGTVSGIEIGGNMILDGTEGALVNTMNGGKISDCTVNVKITSTGEKVGLVVGALNGGTISDTKSIGTNTTLGFVGSADENDSVAVDEDASHYAGKLFDNGSYTETELKQFSEMEDKEYTIRKYKATITDDCTYVLNEKTLFAVTYDPYYYSITGEDGYKADSEPTVKFVAADGVELSEFGMEDSDWTNTGYYFQMLGRYIPVYVMVELNTETVSQPPAVTDGEDENQTDASETTVSPETEATVTETTYTYTFGYIDLSGAYQTLSVPKSTKDPDTYEITDILLYYLSKPVVGETYILTNGTKVLTTAGAVEMGNDIQEDMIWTVGVDNVWDNGNNTITVTMEIPSTGSAQYPMVTVDGAQYQAYSVDISTERDVKLADRNPLYSTTKPQATEN